MRPAARPGMLWFSKRKISSLSPVVSTPWEWRENGSHRKMLVYLNCINIFSRHSEIAENGEGELVAREGLDIVANEVAVHSQPDVDRFSARLAQGILDTNAEAMVLTGCSDGDKPAEISARAAMLGQNLSVIRSPRDGAWQSAKLPEDVRARMEQDLQGGYWVVFGSQNAHDKQDGALCLVAIRPHNRAYPWHGRAWMGASFRRDVLHISFRLPNRIHRLRNLSGKEKHKPGRGSAYWLGYLQSRHQRPRGWTRFCGGGGSWRRSPQSVWGNRGWCIGRPGHLSSRNLPPAWRDSPPPSGHKKASWS